MSGGNLAIAGWQRILCGGVRTIGEIMPAANETRTGRLGTVQKMESTSVIVGPPLVSVADAAQWAIARGAPKSLVTSVAAIYWELAPKLGIRPEVAFAQAMVETADFTFPRCGETVCPDYCNPCGMRTRGLKAGEPETPANHQRFPSWRAGIQAHLDHLALYLGRPGFPKPADETPDPRHFRGLFGKVTSLVNLGDWWVTGGARANPKYGAAIRGRITAMQAVNGPKKESDNAKTEVDEVNWRPTAATIAGVTTAPRVNEVVAGRWNDWTMIALIKAVQKSAGIPVSGKYDQATAEAINKILR